jgi:ABC-2 type transport system permease protein
MFAFLVSGFMAGWSVEEKRNGVARRLLSHPVSSFSLLGGKMLYGLTLSLAQIMILFITSALAFRFDLGKDLLAFGLVCLVLSITVTCLGMLASAVKFPSSAITMPLVIFSILGGCLFTRDLMPPLLRLVSNFIPHSWAMSAFQDLFVRGYGLPQVLPELGILLVFAAVFFGVAVWLYDPLD